MVATSAPPTGLSTARPWRSGWTSLRVKPPEAMTARRPARSRGGWSMRLSDENLRGRTVIAADGQAIGEVAALFLDSEAWGIQSLQVRLRKEIADRIGASRNLFHAGTVEIPIRLIQSVGDAVVLSVPVDGLRQVLPGENEASPVH